MMDSQLAQEEMDAATAAVQTLVSSASAAPISIPAFVQLVQIGVWSCGLSRQSEHDWFFTAETHGSTIVKDWDLLGYILALLAIPEAAWPMTLETSPNAMHVFRWSRQ